MNRTRICLYILLLTPLLVYWQTIFTEYGLRDDYSNMREAREEQGKLVKFTASHGRPLYGALQETSFSKIDEVETLQWMRLATVILLTFLGLALWRQLYQSGWTEVEGAVIGLGVTLLPAAQVTAGWASTWPHVLALLLSLAGFSAIEAELERGGLKRIVALVGGVLIYALAAMIYQSNAVFAVVPIVAVLLVRSGREPATDLRWSIIHVSLLLAGLVTSYLIVKFLFHSGIFHESARLHLESNPLNWPSKLVWFFWEPLPNALALYALRDDHNVGAVVFWAAAVLVAAVIGLGCRFVVERKGSMLRKKWAIAMLVAPFVAHGISLLAAERAIGYRTLFALSTLGLMLLVYALRSLLAAGRIKPVLYYAGMGLLLVSGVVTAHFNTSDLTAQPQGAEWEIIRGAVMRADFKKPNRVYIIRPALEDRTTERLFADEFGSLSTDSDWAPQEIFKAALHERFPKKLPVGGSYTVATGREVPAEADYDLIIDMRKLKQHREP